MNSLYDEGRFDLQAIAATTWGINEPLPPVAESWRRLLSIDDVRTAGRIAMRGLSFIGDKIMATGSPGVHVGTNFRIQSEAPERYRGRHEAASVAARQRSDVVAAAEAIVAASEQDSRAHAAHQDTFASV